MINLIKRYSCHLNATIIKLKKMTESNQATLLVTGGTGYIGSHTVVELL